MTPPRRRSAPSAVALVESPLQLLAAIEAHHAGLLGDRTQVWVRAGVSGLTRTVSELAGCRLPDGLDVVEHGHKAPWGKPVWAIGDAFSGQIQTWLTGPLPRRLVLVDDGLATVELARLLAGDRASIQRLGPGSNPVRRRLGLLAYDRLTRLAGEGRLTLFTALPVRKELRAELAERGGQVQANRFGWLATQPLVDHIREPVVVIGSAMVADGLVRPAPYLDWLAALARRSPVRYYPHRRQTAELLSAIGRLGIAVAGPGLPVEIRLRGLQHPQRVLSLPSTALVLLRGILSRTGTIVEGLPVPNDWWTARADPRLREHLSSVLTLIASHDHGGAVPDRTSVVPPPVEVRKVTVVS